MRKSIKPKRTEAKFKTAPAQLARKPRVDAERNRKLLVSAGKDVFAQSGANASLEEIARRANVGIGTLYRHFPNRDSMIEAVYRREVEQLANSAKELAKLSKPADALYKWMRLFIDYIATKKVLASAVCSTVPGASELASSSGARIMEAITSLVNAGAASGEIRSDVIPGDLLRALAGFGYGGIGPDWKPSALRLVDLLMDGLRTPGTNRRVSQRT
jgi:AcrR family transcriptional regulator